MSSSPDNGVLDRSISEMPIAVFDLETTGFPAGRHRVVELSICRIAADGRSTLVFDSLIDPGRPVTAGEIHGISDSDAESAPRFEDVAGDIVDALAGSVIASYNVTFDIDFLCDELDRVGVSQVPPHLCLMFLRPMLRLGARCSLEDACKEDGIEYTGARSSRGDAESAGDLFGVYRAEIDRQGLSTFSDLLGRGDYPFLARLQQDPLHGSQSLDLPVSVPPHRRVVRELGERSLRGGHEAMRRYWQAVSVALADLEITDVGLGLVRALRELLDLSEEQVRAIHARAFLNALVAYTSDDWFDAEEAEQTRRLLHCLSVLGWAPGD